MATLTPPRPAVPVAFPKASVVREGSSFGRPPGSSFGARRVPGSIEIRGTDPRFPPLLREVVPPPASLFCLGDPSLLSGPAVSIVGSRAATRLGLRMAESLGAALALRGVVVVSGMARGIDSAAHAGALSVGGATVAVLAGGLDVAVPHATRPLGRRIAREGCLVTEYEARTPPLKGRFHERNRIVAGLARVVVIVEAAHRSGALITGRLALEAGREVMVVPGHPLASNSRGVLRYLREGAGVVGSPDDVLHALLALPGVAEELAGRTAPADEESPASAGAAAPPAAPETRGAAPPAALLPVLEAVGEDPEPVESIAERAGVELVAALSALTRLELLGLVEPAPGRRYRRPPTARDDGAGWRGERR